jgi:hypothetical protein
MTKFEVKSPKFEVSQKDVVAEAGGVVHSER